MNAQAQRSRKNEKLIYCRVVTCKQRLYRQNYKTHLMRQHPEENCNDLREHGEQILNFNFFAPVSNNNNRVSNVNSDNVIDDLGEEGKGGDHQNIKNVDQTASCREAPAALVSSETFKHIFHVNFFHVTGDEE